MYLNSALKSLICGAVLSLLSVCMVAWVPRSVVLIMFGSGVFLMAFGWVITLFISFNVIMGSEVASSDNLIRH
jgi:hypothetical protein